MAHKRSILSHLFTSSQRKITEEWNVPYFFLYSDSLIHNKPGYEISCPILSIIIVHMQSEYVIRNLSIRSDEVPAHYCGLGRLSWRNVMYFVPPPYPMARKERGIAVVEIMWLVCTFHRNHLTWLPRTMNHWWYIYL